MTFLWPPPHKVASTRTVTATLLPAVKFAAEVFLLDGGALVVDFLSFGEGDDEFGEAVVVDEKLGGHDGEAFLLDGLTQVTELTLGQQELAVTHRLVLTPGSPEVLGDVHTLDKQFVANEITERIDQRGLAHTY